MYIRDIIIPQWNFCQTKQHTPSYLTTSGGVGPFLTTPFQSLPHSKEWCTTPGKYPASIRWPTHIRHTTTLWPLNFSGHTHWNVPYNEVTVGGWGRYEEVALRGPGEWWNGGVARGTFNPYPCREKSSVCVCVCGGVILNEVSLNGHNFSSVGPIKLILWFSESLHQAL